MWLAKPLGIVGIVAALLIIGVLITTAIQRRRAKGKNKQRVNAACGDSPSARVPVFVMIVSTDNDGAALQTLLSVFAQAACPLRVFAGVAEYFAPGIVKPLPHRFTQAAESSTMPFKLGDHVRALRAPMDEYPGHLIALEQVQRFLYRGEPYVLIATPGVGHHAGAGHGRSATTGGAQHAPTPAHNAGQTGHVSWRCQSPPHLCFLRNQGPCRGRASCDHSRPSMVFPPVLFEGPTASCKRGGAGWRRWHDGTVVALGVDPAASHRPACIPKRRSCSKRVTDASVAAL
jgi:hypothetical protein